MALVGLVEIVIVDDVHKNAGALDLDVHAKYNVSNKWQVKNVSGDIPLDKLWELHLFSATDYVARDAKMMDYIDVIYAYHIKTNGNVDKSYTLYRRPNGMYTKRTKAETEGVNRANEQIIGIALAAATNSK